MWSHSPSRAPEEANVTCWGWQCGRVLVVTSQLKGIFHLAQLRGKDWARMPGAEWDTAARGHGGRVSVQGVGLREARPSLWGKPTGLTLACPLPDQRGDTLLGSTQLSGTETYLPLAQRTRLTHLIQTLEREGLSFLVSFSLENSEQSHLGFFSAFIPLPPPPRGLLYPTLFIFLAETRKYSTMPHLPSVLDTPCFKQISTYKGEGWETWGPPTAALRIGCKGGQLRPPLGEAVTWLPGRRHL